MKIVEMENIIPEIKKKKLLDRFRSRVEIAKGRTSQLENRPIWFSYSEEGTE